MRVVGWGNSQQSEPGFGASNDTASVKAKIVNLIASVRTLMRSMSSFLSPGAGWQKAPLRYCDGEGCPVWGYEEGEFPETAAILMSGTDV